MRRLSILGKGEWLTSVLVSLLIVLGTAGCGKIRTDEERAELASSAFFQEQAAASLVSGTSGSDGGFIPGGPGDGQADGGFIPPDGGSNDNPNDPGDPNDDQAGDPGSDGSNPPGDDVAGNPGGGNPPGNDGSNPPGDNGNDGGTVPGNNDGSQPGSGNDGGTIPGGGNPGGGDTGTVGDNNPPNDGGDDDDDGDDVAGNPGGNNPPGDDGSNPPGNDGDNNPPGDNDGGSIGGNDPPGDDDDDVAGNDPGDGTDGGEIPGGGNPPGDDGGVVGKPIGIRIGRICSEVRSGWKHWVFFEDAENPIVSFEANRPISSPQIAGMGSASQSYLASLFKQYTNTSYWAYVGYSVYGIQTESVLIDSVSLAGINLFDGPYDGEIRFAQHKLEALFPTDWRDTVVRVNVCDDTNGDGRCSDETANKISISEISFLGRNVPNHLRLDVWAGRTFTKRRNPRMCEEQYSPLVLDLKHNGIRLTGAEQGVLFDLNDSGDEVYTGWVAPGDDAFLVRDLDDNGEIDSGAELFGSATRLMNGERAANGFEALKELDSDIDGQITKKDAAWSELKLWRDLNYDGRVGWGELMPLDAAGVESIDLDYVDIHEVDRHGNETRQRSIFRRRLGFRLKPHKIVDVWFRTLQRE